MTNYSARGTVKSVGGSYGTLVAGITRRADGLVTNLVYGDSAGTQTSTTYDDRRRPTSIQTYRASSALWSAFAAGGTPLENITYSPPPSVAGTPTNFQMLLEDTDIAYDEVGNPIELRDWREPSEWPANNKPVTKKIEYDDLYRVRRMDYLYATETGMDGFQSPYTRENTEIDANRDSRRAKAAPHLSFTNRPMWQRFEYDWLGNLSETDDDAHGFYDRSLGTQSHANAGKPYQLSGATNSTQAASSGSLGSTATLYDVTGNLRAMTVARSTARLSCRPSGSGCNQYYAYDYDEVGRLVRARRWDSATAYPAPNASNLPAGNAQIELRYRYDASDQRVIKRVFATNVADQRHTLYVFGSLEVRRTAFAGDVYTISNESLVPYAMANGVRLARLHYSEGANSPQVDGLGVASLPYRTNTAATLHVVLELGDHLGSTGTVLDKLTSELVEKTTYLPFGARENDYRGTDGAGGSNRWSSFREDYGFTGKEEDVEVGLTYFGKRFLSPQLGRWVTADPLAVHSAGKADYNLYAYVSGAVLKNVDPVGLEETIVLPEVEIRASPAEIQFSDQQIVDQANMEDLAAALDRSDTDMVNRMSAVIQGQEDPGAKPAGDPIHSENGLEKGLANSTTRLLTGQWAPFGPDYPLLKVFNDTTPADELLGDTITAGFTEAVGAAASMGQGVAIARRAAASSAKAATFTAVRPSQSVLTDIGQLSGTNCFNIAMAVERRLAGSPLSALRGAGVSLDEGYAALRAIYPQGTTSSFTQRGAMEKVMLSGGEGTRGVVFGTGANPHVFNAVVSNGRVVFIDGSTGGRASLAGYTEFDVFFTQLGGGF